MHTDQKANQEIKENLIWAMVKLSNFQEENLMSKKDLMNSSIDQDRNPIPNALWIILMVRQLINSQEKLMSLLLNHFYQCMEKTLTKLAQQRIIVLVQARVI